MRQLSHAYLYSWVQGVTIVISLSAIWKVWVVSHHLSARDCAKMVLADLFSRRQVMGLKPAPRMWAFVSLARSLYHLATQLVLPLPEYKDEACKKDYDDIRFTIWINKQWKWSFRSLMRSKVVLELQSGV